MQIYNLSWIGLPIVTYFVWKKYYLHSGELWFLFYASILMASTLINSTIMQIVHLIIITAIAMHTLSMAKQTSGFIPQKKLNQFVKVVFKLQEELSIIVYIISAWLILRVYTNQSFQFGIGRQYQKGKIFRGVNSSLKGWNCTQLEFVIIPLIWLILNCLSYYLGNLIIHIQTDKDNLYKEFLLKYKIIPDILFSLIAVIYNLYSYSQANTLFQCIKYWQNGYLMQVSVYIGFSFSILYWFYKKKGLFQVDDGSNTSDKADNQYKPNEQMYNFK